MLPRLLSTGLTADHELVIMIMIITWITSWSWSWCYLFNQDLIGAVGLPRLLSTDIDAQSFQTSDQPDISDIWFIKMMLLLFFLSLNFNKILFVIQINLNLMWVEVSSCGYMCIVLWIWVAKGKVVIVFLDIMCCCMITVIGGAEYWCRNVEFCESWWK